MRSRERRLLDLLVANGVITLRQSQEAEQLVTRLEEPAVAFCGHGRVGRLGELLLREKIISQEQLAQAVEEQKAKGGFLVTHLVRLGFVNEDELTQFLSRQYNLPPIILTEVEIDSEIIKLVPREVAEKHIVLPVNRARSSLILAMADPLNIFAIDDIKFLTGYNVEAVVATETAIRAAIEKYYPPKKKQDIEADLREALPGKKGEQDLAPRTHPLPTYEEVIREVEGYKPSPSAGELTRKEN
ncbi:MAG: hypothetical protein Q8M83_03350 [bacterium]|nr:hypothetical protein [bacterium]